MKLIEIQEDILINPDKIVSVERRALKSGSIQIKVTVEGGATYEVRSPHMEFLKALNSVGVDLTKQYFSV